MENLTYKKINFDLSFYDYQEGTGYYEIVIPSCIMTYLIDELEFYNYYNEDGDFYSFIYDKDYEYIKGENYDLFNPDTFICILNQLFKIDKEELETLQFDDIKISIANPYWLLHDICHAEKDCTGNEVYVDAEIEEERLIDGIKLAKKLNYNISFSEIEILEIFESYKLRWKRRLSTEIRRALVNNIESEITDFENEEDYETYKDNIIYE